MMPITMPSCLAGDTSFLTTLAYCINSTCQTSEPIWKLEKYWALQATGDLATPPKWDYQTALQQITKAPDKVLAKGATLNFTALVNPATYSMQKNFMVLFERLETYTSTYVIILITVGVGTPILFTVLGYLPFVTSIYDKLKLYLVWPSTIGTYHVHPLPWLLGNPPTVGQSLYIAMFFILNFVLSAVNYGSSQPHPWGYNKHQEILAYVGYRTGHISFALLPLTILFSGRNNFLLWLTNWSHSTFILLHRWVARIFTIQAIIHSVTLLAAYANSGIYGTNHKLPFWSWGIVGTLFASIMLVVSLLWLHRMAYEVFLISHILLTVFVIVGSWYHVILRFGYTGIYEYWIYAACAVWFFDRLVRVLRIIKNGMRRAVVTEVGPDHVRVDIEGVRWSIRPGLHAYAYFPTLNPLRPWENHPFSVNSTAVFHSHRLSISTPSDSIHHSEGQDVEKANAKAKEVPGFDKPATTAGVTLIIRKNAGLTSYLKKSSNLLTLLDGPYPNNYPYEVLKCDRVLLIGGGIGITGLLAWVNAHGNVKLAWSVKESAQALVQELDPVLKGISDKEVLIGQRPDINALLMQEVLAGWKRVGVVVCGPGGFADDVRAMVVKLGRHEKTVFELEVDAYSW